MAENGQVQEFFLTLQPPTERESIQVSGDGFSHREPMNSSGHMH